MVMLVLWQRTARARLSQKTTFNELGKAELNLMEIY